jgi:hypothetical protein
MRARHYNRVHVEYRARSERLRARGGVVENAKMVGKENAGHRARSGARESERVVCVVVPFRGIYGYSQNLIRQS